MTGSDVIVVGGGPAGSTCARRLADAGARVSLVDGATFPRDKVCAGWITPDVIETVAMDVDEYSASRTFQPIRRFRIGRVNRDEALVTRGETMVSAAIRRCEFDAYLLGRSGARVFCGESVRSIRRDGSVWIVNERWSAPMLIGAGGSGCPVARHLNGATSRDLPLIVARETEFVMESPGDCRVEPTVPELYFTGDLLGYGWCVRKGDMLNVGLGRLGRHLPRESVDGFTSFLRRSRGVAVPPLERWRGHSYLAGAPSAHRRTADGLLLIGDAAGLADDRSGEGIGPAVESAVMAATAVAAAGGQPGRSHLDEYEAGIAARWQRRGNWPVLARLMPAAAAPFIAGQLLKSRAFVEQVVVRRWFLHAHDLRRAA